MLAVIDCRSPAILERALLKMGHEVCKLPPLPALAAPVQAHPDMLLFFAEDAVFTHCDYYPIAKKELDRIAAHVNKSIRFSITAPSALYPRDVPLNAVPVNEHLLCNEKTVDPLLLELYPASKRINVKQGYTKCSVLPVAKSALITEDPSITAAALQNGLDRLLLPCKEVKLRGYDAGFIGGASSYAPYEEPEEILFSGDWRLHSQAEQLLAFCARYGKHPVSLLPSVELLDVGTIFLI